MELIIVPVTLVVGMALVYWGIHGAPGQAAQMAFASSPGHRPPLKARRPYTPPVNEEPELPELDLSPSSLRQSDVLLADLMTEMIEMRTEISKIKSKLAEIEPVKTEPVEKVQEPLLSEEKFEPVSVRSVRRRTHRVA
jgi:hypothetical protein